MGKNERTDLSRIITRGRIAAGSLRELVDALGEPKISLRTLEDWEQERRRPPDYTAAAVIDRIERFLKM